MIVIILIAVLVAFAADTIYSRARLALRRRSAEAPQRPAWDIKRSRGGWHPIEPERPSNKINDDTDLSRLFGGPRR